MTTLRDTLARLGEGIAVDVFLGLGSNVGDRLEALEACVHALDDITGLMVTDVSGIYETLPVGGPDQEPYLNAVVRGTTTLLPEELLAETQLIENALGRDRSREDHWGPRTLDIDLLLYDDVEIDEPELIVPHPRLHERAFVLVPLLEVFPGGAVPDGRRLTQLITDLAPIEGVELYVRLTDVPGGHLERPEGPAGPGAFMADEWERPEGPPPGVYR